MNVTEIDLIALFTDIKRRAATNADGADHWFVVNRSTTIALLALEAARLGMPAADLHTKYVAWFATL